MTKRKLWIAATLAATFAAAPVRPQKSDNAAGFVLDVQGGWIDSRTGQPLRKIDAVEPGDTITPKQPPSMASYISISLYDKTEKTLRCSDAKGCNVSYQVPKINSSDPWYHGIVSAALKLYPSELKKLVIGASRGESGPVEAVIELPADGRLNLAPALRAVNPGEYTAKLFPWPKGDRESSLALAVSVSWHPPGAVLQGRAPLAPGLYQLELTSRNGDLVGSRAAVLIATAKDYSRLEQTLAKLNQTTGAWNDVDNEAISVRSFRTAVLVALANDPALAGQAPE